MMDCRMVATNCSGAQKQPPPGIAWSGCRLVMHGAQVLGRFSNKWALCVKVTHALCAVRPSWACPKYLEGGTSGQVETGARATYHIEYLYMDEH